MDLDFRKDLVLQVLKPEYSHQCIKLFKIQMLWFFLVVLGYIGIVPVKGNLEFLIFNLVSPI